MGHNGVSASLVGSLRDEKTSQDPNYNPESTEISFFNVHEQKSAQEFINGPNIMKTEEWGSQRNNRREGKSFKGSGGRVDKSVQAASQDSIQSLQLNNAISVINTPISEHNA